jgi:hypothetical protein
VWSPCCPRTIHTTLAASPCARLSRARSTISQSDFRQTIGPSSLCSLVRPYKLRLSLTDLPCSHACLRAHADGTNPGSTPEHSPRRTLRFRLPHWETGSATSTTFDFGAMFPFTVVSAYALPVYASQCPLPVHHARLGTWRLARPYQGRHLRRPTNMRLQGATPSEPYVRFSRIRLSGRAFPHRDRHATAWASVRVKSPSFAK